MERHTKRQEDNEAANATEEGARARLAASWSGVLGDELSTNGAPSYDSLQWHPHQQAHDPAHPPDHHPANHTLPCRLDDHDPAMATAHCRRLELQEKLSHSLYLDDRSSWQMVDSACFSSLPVGPSELYPILPNGVKLSSSQPDASPLSQAAKANHKAEEVDADQTDNNIKTKFMSAWNNVRHGWTVRTKTNFSYSTPICLLGCRYSSTPKEREQWKSRQEKGIAVITAMEKFKQDFTSRIWFTYRQDFAPLLDSAITSDVGWGCMLRSGQMIIAQALQMHYLGREWRWYPQQTKQDIMFHRRIVSFFADLPSVEAPFSLHSLVTMGLKLGKKPGDWYGPASVAHVFKEAMELVPKSNPFLSQLALYVAPDCTVYRQDVLDLCCREHKSESPSLAKKNASWKALIILIPLRLGGENLNTLYVPAIRTILAHDMCLGFIGGKPKHSAYFVGWQEEKLIYMDPHFCQDTVDSLKPDCPLQSFHCMSPRKMSFGRMDPSCTVGFYCKTRADFENFCLEIPQMAAPQGKGDYPMFVLSEGTNLDIRCGSSDRAGDIVRVQHLDHHGNVRTLSKESDDFIFL